MNHAAKIILWGFSITNAIMMLVFFWGMRLGEVCLLEPNTTILVIETSLCLCSLIFLIYLGLKDIKSMAQEKEE